MLFTVFALLLIVGFLWVVWVGAVQFERWISNSDDSDEEVEAQIKAQLEAEEQQWEEARKWRLERKKREQDRQDKRQEQIMKRAFLQAIREYDEEQNGSLAVSKANPSPSETSTSNREGIVSTKFSGSKAS